MTDNGLILEHSSTNHKHQQVGFNTSFPLLRLCHQTSVYLAGKDTQRICMSCLFFSSLFFIGRLHQELASNESS